MISRLEFTQFLWESMTENDYVWLNPAIRLEKEKAIPEILIATNAAQELLTRMRKHPDIGACRASFRFQNTFALFSFDGWEYGINFVHKMVSRNLFFLSDEELAQRKVMLDGYYIPCIEHIWEYTVLNAFLNQKGLNEEEFRFFKDYHILVQEDLVEFFNDKYGTSFNDINSFTEYEIRQKRAIVLKLKEMEINRFVKVVNIHWHNFLGRVRKEAKMI